MRLLIAEDHELVAAGFRTMLEGWGHSVVGIVCTGLDLAAAVARLCPDVLLLDLSLPGKSGSDLIPELLLTSPNLRILVVTMHADRLLAEAVLQLGVQGFISKVAGADELQTALSEVHAGRRYTSPDVAGHSGAAPESPEPREVARLTPRQRAILCMIGQGMETGAIAGALGVSVHTVHFHRRKIHTALGLHTELDLVRYAVLASLAAPAAR